MGWKYVVNESPWSAWSSHVVLKGRTPEDKDQAVRRGKKTEPRQNSLVRLPSKGVCDDGCRAKRRNHCTDNQERYISTQKHHTRRHGGTAPEYSFSLNTFVEWAFGPSLFVAWSWFSAALLLARERSRLRR
jgi:hypothetical protein